MANLKNTTSLQPVRPSIAVLIYLALHGLLAWLTSLNLGIISGITPWHPQAGLTLALFILYGHRMILWPILAIIVSRWIIGGTQHWQSIMLFAVIVSTAQAFAAGLFRARMTAASIASTQQLLRLIMVGILAGIVTATTYWTMQVQITNASANGSTITAEVAGFLTGQLNGILTITPLLLWLSGIREYRLPERRRLWELAAQIVATVTALWMVLGWQFTDGLHFYYPLFVVMVWFAFRWGVTGAVLYALAIQVTLIVAIDDQTHRLPYFDVQLLILTLAITGMVLGAVANDRLFAQRQAAIREIEQQTVMTIAPDAIVAVDARRQIVAANPAASQMFAAGADIMGRAVDRYLPNVEFNGTQGRTSIKGQRDSGDTFPSDVSWAKLDTPSTNGFLLICRDESKRVANEIQLRERDASLARATRFAIVGELSSALTHELNQPITALVSYLRAVQILAEPIAASDPRLQDTLNKASTQAIRAADVLHRVRDFYRGGPARRELLNIVDITERVVKTQEDQLRQFNIECHQEHIEPSRHLHCDQIQMEMILHNLLTNAIDSLCSTKDATRRIVIKTRYTADNMIMEIEDSGPGVAEEIAANVFEPFVTTKPDGMGLGLAISRSLLRSQGGDLHLKRSALGGARLVINLPFETSTQTTL